MYYLTFQFFKEFIPRCRTFKKHDVAKTEDLVWLNQFGTIGTFLKMISNSSNETSVLKPP
jgi:cytochrome b subunit of formate dehydrogenase